MASDALREFRRGWRTLLASGMGNGAGLGGLPVYTFGVFVVPLVEAFGWTRGQISSAASFLIVGSALTAPIIGGIVDRYGVRRVGLASMIALALGYALLTQLGGTIAMFYAAWLALSLIGGGTTPVVWTRTVGVWFDRGRGLAAGALRGRLRAVESRRPAGLAHRPRGHVARPRGRGRGRGRPGRVPVEPLSRHEGLRQDLRLAADRILPRCGGRPARRGPHL
ncbi:MAG: MFS transporter [Gammaproteobacteria bacterium]|nr:MFS transporter [Gammaproteobacteria bacterium]